MAELPDVGGRCDFDSCNRLDFLPFTCPLCKCCYWHRHADEHSCDAVPEKAPKPCPQIKLPVAEPPAKPEKPAVKAKSAPMNPGDQKKMDKILIMKLKMNAKATADVPPEERIFLFVEGDDLNGRQAVVVSRMHKHNMAHLMIGVHLANAKASNKANNDDKTWKNQ
ncbi:hypothetical protein ANCCEY_00608 [Ancylostoma ceylanicum]|uniref:AN1-type domain-containing protein n=1 Tax=Ancylostoma ceylanicum TaxID=53326 RepID=A0A0D6MBI0_9BILA|nr:hypothetical protein ANCCEY_00608 [Ancylostoma ceylanicum]